MSDTAVLCRDVLAICDGYGCSLLNSCGWCCMLEAGHGGPHYDEFEHEGKSVVITWQDTGNDSVPIANSQHLLFVRQIEAPVARIV